MLSDCFLPRLGGIEVQVHDLSQHLLAAGHQVEVFTATPGPQGQRHGVVEVVDGLTVHRLATRLPFDLPVNPLAVPQLRHRLATGGADGRPFDVAHVHLGVVSPFAVDAARIAVGLDLPTALTWHCVLARTAYAVQALGVVRSWQRRGAVLSAVSQVAAAGVRTAVGGRPDGSGPPVAVLPNGIDLSAWQRPPGVSAPARPVRIVTAMRLARRKRAVPFLHMLRRLREQLPGSVELAVEIYGEGPDRGAMERFLHAQAMTSWVHLPGRLSRPELAQRYSAAHLYVAPARLESFGIAALEARSAGLPVVARRESGVGEFVTDGVNGFLAVDDEDVVARVAQLVTDDGLRERMTAYNLANPAEQDWPRVVGRTLAEYRRAGAGG